MDKGGNARFENEIYHDYEWCYQKFIIEGLNQAEMAAEANTKPRTIHKWLVEKHRLTGSARKELKKLNTIQEDLIIGSVLGDGHITNKKFIPIFIVSHAQDEKDYLYWKYGILEDICNSRPRIIKSSKKIFNGKIYISQDAHRFNTRSLDDLKRFRDMSIINILEKLNEFSFSVWMLDDGHRSPYIWELCVAPFGRNEINKILNIMLNKFSLECKLKTSDERYIRFSAKSSRCIDAIILNNIPNELDVIKKKITENNVSKETVIFWVDYRDDQIGLRRFCDENKLPYKTARDYYISGVTEGHSLIEAVEIHKK